MKIAVEGCAHGELEKIYECLEILQKRENVKIDLLICCGDFQSVRNYDDLRGMAVPEKYYNLHTFYKYYSGEKKAPVLTIFIGGNHEASNFLQELPYGGWVAPNIFYMGRAGVVKVGNLRIGGMSGIFKGQDYLQGLWESPPYSPNSLRSVYHVRSLDVFRLKQVKEKVHIMLSHDWPTGITNYGDKEKLLKWKPYFRQDIESNQLGSPPAENLLHSMKPDYWFSAHLHCQFAALVRHEDLTETKFLALDKCLPKRRHLQILDLPSEFDGDKQLRFDEEWLSILKSTNHLLSVRNIDCHMPGPGCDERYNFTPTLEEKNNIKELMGDMSIKEDSFVINTPPFDPNTSVGKKPEPLWNPQTAILCEKLGIDDPLQVVLARSGRTMVKYEHFDKVDASENKDVVTPQKNTNKDAITPAKFLKLSLPEPVTPGANNTMNSDTVCTPFNKKFHLDAVGTNSSDCDTPVSTEKKKFKRRNQSIYSAEDESNTSSSLLDSDSPRSSKVPYRESEQYVR